MSPCTDPSVGRLLAEYELGLLASEDRDAFELHTLACDDCFRELDRLADVSATLRTSEAAWESVRGAASLPDASPWHVRLGRWLWPAGGPWLKPAVSLAALALVAVWQGWTPDTPGDPARPTVRPVQEHALTSLRGSTGHAQLASLPNVDLVVVFGAEFGSPSRPVEVTALGPQLDTLFHSGDVRLDARLQGRLNLGPGPHRPGTYTLVVHDPGAPPPFDHDTLRFEMVSPPTQTR